MCHINKLSFFILSNIHNLIHQVYSEVVSRLKKAFAGVVSKIGDPLLAETLIGPLHTPAAVEAYKKTVAEIVKQGGTIEFGGKVSINGLIALPQ